jgi:hypothetical protein
MLGACSAAVKDNGRLGCVLSDNVSIQLNTRQYSLACAWPCSNRNTTNKACECWLHHLLQNIARRVVVC